MANPRIAIIVLNWNGLADTLECIASLKALEYGNCRIIVADNGSSDNSLPVLRAKHPDAVYIDNRENLGFAGGNNRAIQYALDQGFDALFILNNDTVVDKNCLTALVSATGNLPADSVLGCQIRYYDQPESIWNFGARWDRRKLKLREIARGQTPELWKAVEPVDQIIGCAMFIPAPAMRKVGMFDERFFLNYEETDWCFRAKALGIGLYCIPDAVIYHKVSASFTSSAHSIYYLSRNRLLWIEKNFPFATRLRLYARQDLKRLLAALARLPFLILAVPILNLASAGMAGHYSRRLDNDIARLTGVFDYCRRRFGPCPGFLTRPKRI